MKRPPSFFVTTACALLLAGCSKAPDSTPVPKPKTGALVAPASVAAAVDATQVVAVAGTASDGAKTAAAAAAPRTANASADAAEHESGIAWQRGDVDAAFATAKAERKPVFLYWGAGWCPPCNQVKATVFNRQDFIERSRFFVPVYVDGDEPNAQRLGQRFKVSGYPTMILFRPDGGEITRLPGEVDADQYMRVLAMGMNGARPVADTLAAALRGGGATLGADDWRMLAYYSWDTDEHRLVAERELAPTLTRLARSCPADQRATAVRLSLRSLVAAATAKNVKPRPDAARVAEVMAVLDDPARSRENFDLLTYYADSVTSYITAPGSPDRSRLSAAWTRALERIADDPSVSSADRLGAIQAQVTLARLDAAKASLPAAMLERVRAEVARADKAAKDGYTRQSVISAAADLLATAGLMDESNALLEAELGRSHSPYYFMSGLADNAKKSGDKAAALDWHAKAYAASDGPATRLQWGARYVGALVELAPQDSARIEAAALEVVGEAKKTPDAFFGRSGRALARMGQRLAAWQKAPAKDDAKDNENDGAKAAKAAVKSDTSRRDRAQRDAALAHIRARLAGVCGKLPADDPSRKSCAGVLAGKTTASA